MKKWILVMVAMVTVLALGLAACSNSLAPTVAPTYTPYPTYTPAPVPTQPPPPTGMPTYTPYPTYTPVPLPTATPAPGSPTPTPQLQQLPVGLSAPLSGSAAAWGLVHDRSAELAGDELAAAGGIKAGGSSYVFKFVEDDNKYTADGGVAVANKQIFQDHVQYEICFGSNSALAILPIVQANKVVLIPGSYDSHVIGPQLSYVFRVCMGSDQFTPATWHYLRTQYPDVHKVGYINVDTSSGLGLRVTDNAAMAAEGGFQIVSDVVYEPGTADFSPLATKLLAGKPDVVCTGGMPPGDQALAIGALRDQGFKGKIITNTGFDFDTVTNMIPKSDLNGLITAIPDFTSTKIPDSLKNVYFAYLKKYGPPFSIVAQMGYDGVKCLAAGVEAANSTDPTAVRDAMNQPGFSYAGCFGASSFGGKAIYGIDHQVYYQEWACEYNNGSSAIAMTVQGSDVLALQQKMWQYMPTPTPASK